MAVEIKRKSGDQRAALALGALGAAGAAAAGAVGIERLKQARSEASSKESARDYRFKRGEPIAEAVRRVAAGRMDDALETLRMHASDDRAEAVHAVRKDLKKLRSLLRLARPALGGKLYRRESRRARDAGRALAGMRDAQVKVETLEALLERRSGQGLTGASFESFAGRLKRDRDAAAAHTGEAPAALEAAAREIERARAGVEEWTLRSGDWEAIEAGLERSYRRGRKRFRIAAADPSGENMHEWRKRVKDHWYQLRLLREAWPPLLKPAVDEAHQLADLIGEDHDLVVLHEDAVANPEAFEDPHDLERLTELIDRRREELIEESLALGRLLYAEKPKRFVKRIGAYWEAGYAAWPTSS